MKALVIAVPLTLLLAAPAAAATGMDKTDTATLRDSVTVLNALADAPDKGIPQDLFAKAHCILVFPSVTKAAFIVGGKGGHGVASCRQPDGRMGPVAMNTIGGASIGFQARVDQTDFVMLVMNETGIRHLYGEKTSGAEILMDSKLGVPAAVAKEAQEEAKEIAVVVKGLLESVGIGASQREDS